MLAGVATSVIIIPVPSTHQAVTFTTMILIAVSTADYSQACTLLSHFGDLLLERIFLKQSLFLRIFLCLGGFLERIFLK